MEKDNLNKIILVSLNNNVLWMVLGTSLGGCRRIHSNDNSSLCSRLVAAVQTTSKDKTFE